MSNLWSRQTSCLPARRCLAQVAGGQDEIVLEIDKGDRSLRSELKPRTFQDRPILVGFIVKVDEQLGVLSVSTGN